MTLTIFFFYKNYIIIIYIFVEKLIYYLLFKIYVYIYMSKNYL